MEWRTFVLAKAILFLFAVVTFIAYNFWELHQEKKKDEAKLNEDPSGQVSEAQREDVDPDGGAST